MIRKRIIILSISIFILFALVFSASSLMLSDSNINGFVGVWGIVRLNAGAKPYVKLTDEPLQYIVRNSEFEETFPESYFEKWETDGLIYGGKGIKDGHEYSYRRRAFSSKYCIVTIEKIE